MLHTFAVLFVTNNFRPHPSSSLTTSILNHVVILFIKIFKLAVSFIRHTDIACLSHLTSVRTVHTSSNHWTRVRNVELLAMPHVVIKSLFQWSLPVNQCQFDEMQGVQMERCWNNYIDNLSNWNPYHKSKNRFIHLFHKCSYVTNFCHSLFDFLEWNWLKMGKEFHITWTEHLKRWKIYINCLFQQNSYEPLSF